MEDRSVYPKVKVKVKEQNDQDDPKGSSLFPLNDDSCFPVEHEDLSPLCVAKIPMSYVPNAPMPTISEPEGVGKNDKKIDKDDNINNRASSILRPRAILSSPDNDVTIGNKNRSKKVKQPSPLKNPNLVQSRHVHCKAISSGITERPFNTRISKDADDGKSDLRGKKGSALSVPSQKKYLRTVKPSSMGT
ncbi:hypothetical protein I3760_02G106800 [Carya illinoinensis]|nr:hypothetical protein I3760_02G106800 [Carya illinoinensis]